MFLGFSLLLCSVQRTQFLPSCQTRGLKISLISLACELQVMVAVSTEFRKTFWQLCSNDQLGCPNIIIRQRQSRNERWRLHLCTSGINRHSYLNQLPTSSSQRQTDSLSGERGRLGEKTTTGQQYVLYFYLTQMMGLVG